MLLLHLEKSTVRASIRGGVARFEAIDAQRHFTQALGEGNRGRITGAAGCEVSPCRCGSDHLRKVPTVSTTVLPLMRIPLWVTTPATRSPSMTRSSQACWKIFRFGVVLQGLTHCQSLCSQQAIRLGTSSPHRRAL